MTPHKFVLETILDKAEESLDSCGTSCDRTFTLVHLMEDVARLCVDSKSRKEVIDALTNWEV